MKIPVTYIFPPAQEVTVRKAVPAQDTVRQLPPQLPQVWEINGGRKSDPCGLRNKYRPRPKFRRAVLEVEAA